MTTLLFIVNLLFPGIPVDHGVIWIEDEFSVAHGEQGSIVLWDDTAGD